MENYQKREPGRLMRFGAASILFHLFLVPIVISLFLITKEAAVDITEIEILPPVPEKRVRKKRTKRWRDLRRQRRQAVRRSLVKKLMGKNDFRGMEIGPRKRSEPVVPLTETRLPTASYGKKLPGRLSDRSRKGGDISPKRRSSAVVPSTGIGGSGIMSTGSSGGGGWYTPGLKSGKRSDIDSRIKLTNLVKAVSVGTRRVSRTVVRSSQRYVIISYPDGIAIRITRVSSGLVYTKIRRSRESAPRWDMRETYHQAIHTLKLMLGKR